MSSTARACPWPGCGKPVRSGYLMCRADWFRLPQALRDRINATYRPAQTALTCSPEYRDALHDALTFARQAARGDR